MKSKTSSTWKAGKQCPKPAFTFPQCISRGIWTQSSWLLDDSKQGIKTAISTFEKAQDIFTLVGCNEDRKRMECVLINAKSLIGEIDIIEHVENSKIFYEQCKKALVQTIQEGLTYVHMLGVANRNRS